MRASDGIPDGQGAAEPVGAMRTTVARLAPFSAFDSC